MAKKHRSLIFWVNCSISLVFLPDGSKATLLAGCGPTSAPVNSDTALTSHSFTQPYESHEAKVSP